MWTERWRCGSLRSFNNLVVIVDAISERLDIRVVVVRVGATFISAPYRPPRPSYTAQSLLQYIDVCIEEINQDFLDCRIILAGDLNQLPDKEILKRIGLMSIVHQPTRGTNILDRVYVSSHEYSTVRIMASTVHSDHGAVVAYCCTDECTLPKTHQQCISYLCEAVR